ncbi:MAG: hypothetical protein Q4A56_00925 [Porphyromonadaceae bacterium]|nr:hypothetical protein [Porphyromonadaceae bacterium]
MKKIFLILGVITLSYAVFAQDNSKGIEYYEAGLFDFAKTYFEQQKNTNADIQSEKYYYLGLISIAENTDSASYFFEKSVLANIKSPWGYIGKGLIYLSESNEKEATTAFKKAESLGKKNAAVPVNIAKAYFSQKNKDKAKEFIAKAKKLNPNYSGIYLTEGDFLMEENLVGDAMGKYEQAQYFNTTDKLSTLKLARMYVKMNRNDLALDQLNSIFATDANNIPATIVFGEIKNAEGKFKEAITAFEKVIAAGNAPINIYERYAQALYFDKQYAKSLEQTVYCLKQNPGNLTTIRINAYNNYELGNYQETLSRLDNLMSIANPKNIIYLDYITYGDVLTKVTPKTVTSKNSQDTIDYVVARRKITESYEKAIQLRPEIADTYKQFATSYYSFFEYAKAIPLYEKYFELNPNYLTMDMFTYSDASLNTAKIHLAEYSRNKDKFTQEQLANNKANFMTYINKGVEANNKIIERAPDLYLGYYGKARINALVDDYERISNGKVPGIAKESFEEAITKMLEQNQDQKLNNNIIEGYNYLSAYYISNGDVKNTIDVNQKILLVDANNERAAYVLQQLNAPRTPAAPKTNKK